MSWAFVLVIDLPNDVRMALRWLALGVGARNLAVVHWGQCLGASLIAFLGL